MPNHSKFQEKMDVLDIIIGILRDHEENLSKLADQFEAICKDLSAFEDRVSFFDRFLKRLDGLKVKSVVGPVGLKGPLVTVECKDWLTFRSASQGTLFVAFEVADDLFAVSSISDLFIFTYSEKLPEMEMRIGEGVKKQFTRRSEDIDLETPSLEKRKPVCRMILKPRVVKRWLSSELGVPEERIVEGRILR